MAGARPTAAYADEAHRLLPSRADRRRNTKKACCALCDKPMGTGDRMDWRQPDPRRENWGLMVTTQAHPRCAAKAWQQRCEAAEEALAALKSAASKYLTEDRVQAAGLWTPSQGAP
jgi:hypothetical protein